MSDKEMLTDNGAVMHAALVKIRHFADDYEQCVTKAGALNTIYDLADNALSKPARNCDIYETETERRTAFIEWYNRTWDLKGLDAISSCDLKHDVDGILHDYIDWLFDTAESKTKEETDESR